MKKVGFSIFIVVAIIIILLIIGINVLLWFVNAIIGLGSFALVVFGLLFLVYFVRKKYYSSKGELEKNFITNKYGEEEPLNIMCYDFGNDIRTLCKCTKLLSDGKIDCNNVSFGDDVENEFLQFLKDNGLAFYCQRGIETDSLVKGIEDLCNRYGYNISINLAKVIKGNSRVVEKRRRDNIDTFNYDINNISSQLKRKGFELINIGSCYDGYVFVVVRKDKIKLLSEYSCVVAEQQ